MKSDLVDIAVEIVHETERAVLVSDGTRKAWLPKSQVALQHDSDDSVTATMPEWIAKEKGLI